MIDDHYIIPVGREMEKVKELTKRTMDEITDTQLPRITKAAEREIRKISDTAESKMLEVVESDRRGLLIIINICWIVVCASLYFFTAMPKGISVIHNLGNPNVIVLSADYFDTAKAKFYNDGRLEIRYRQTQ